MIQVWGADLSLFQFDGDLTMATFLMNPDRTIYGRYGSRSGGNANADVSLDGLKKALAGALELHKGYPANKKALAGKTGPVARWKTPDALPTLQGKHTPWDLTDSRKGCLHCHQIHDNQIRSAWSLKQPVPDSLLWKYPLPDDLGLHLDPNERAKVVSVLDESPGRKAGFAVGDDIAEMEGQPILSVADVQWVLHMSPESGELKVRVHRGGAAVDLALTLAPGWRRKGEFLGRRRAWTLQAQITGMTLEPLQGAGLRVAAIGTNARSSPAASRTGLQVGDVIVGIDGKNADMSVSAFMAYLFQKKSPGQKVVLNVQRNGKTQTMEMVLVPSDL
jgi:serine protease Do